MEQLDYNLLYRWFVGLGVDDPVWDATTFTKNRDRLRESGIANRFFEEIVEQARQKGLISKEHFTVDGTLIEAWASQKSFRKKDGSDDPPGSGRNAEADFRGQTRTNDTHESTTDPDALLKRKGGEGAKLVHHGHVMSENRNGLIVDAKVTRATGKAEAQAAVEMIRDREPRNPITVGADKAYDQGPFVDEVRKLGATPHVAQCITRVRGSRIDGRTTRHGGYAISQQKRKRVEEAFGWADRWASSKDPPSRYEVGRLDLSIHDGGVQPGSDEDLDRGAELRRFLTKSVVDRSSAARRIPSTKRLGPS